MDDYSEFLAQKTYLDVNAGFDCEPENDRLFDFQRVIVRWALRRGRAAIFADTGLGKTLMQAVWAHHVAQHTDRPVLILAPLAVAKQTVSEAGKFGVDIEYRRDDSENPAPITVTNYELLDHFDPDQYSGIVLDESSILKHQQSRTRERLIRAFRSTPYRLTCTATPSPNDHMELGNQADFLGVVSAAEMLSMFFTHDGGNTSKWRLKGHGRTRFWEWLSTWAVVLRRPSDIGFADDGYVLPGLDLVDHVVKSDLGFGEMFPVIAQNMTDRRRAQRSTVESRSRVVADLVAADPHEQWLIWCHLNEEGDTLRKLIPGSVEVSGSDTMESKERQLMAFSDGDIRVLITKPSIAGFGMNWQQCARMAFVGLDDSFEQFYQAVRRCYRFGQSRIVQAHLIHAESEGAVKANIDRKADQHEELSENMVAHMRDLMKQKMGACVMQRAEYQRDVAKGPGWTLYLGDCVEVSREIPDNSIGLTVFSPPFASLYTYSNSDRDMGNCKDNDEFYNHFRFLVAELFRITMPGRHVSFHAMNLPTSKFRDGVIGIRDFRGELIRMFEEFGFIYHSEVTIWKDPVTAMQRTKALGLLHKQLKKDSAMSRQGIPDYLVTMRKPGENQNPVTHTNETFPVRRWQDWASPVWMDINPSDTLQFRMARDNDDERHICPLQLGVIERAVVLWSNPGDMVFSPFAGIGSEGYKALQLGRRFTGVELKPSYWKLAKKNLSSAMSQTQDMFSSVNENEDMPARKVS